MPNVTTRELSMGRGRSSQSVGGVIKTNHGGRAGMAAILVAGMVAVALELVERRLRALAQGRRVHDGAPYWLAVRGRHTRLGTRVAPAARVRSSPKRGSSQRTYAPSARLHILAPR